MALAYAPEQEGVSEQDKAARAEKLLRLLKSEEEEARGYAQTEVTEQQIEALKRYFGEPYGDEEEGRSRITTREVFEAIQQIIPDLMRVFTAGGNFISLEETSEQDGAYAKDAADYLNWILTSDNPGYRLLHDFAFDGLLHRRGYLACYWRDKEYRAPQTLSGLNIQQVQMLAQDPSVEIIGQDFDTESEAAGITLVVRRTKSPARAEICAIAPEDMRLNGRAIEIDGSRYVGCVKRMLRGEAAHEWPDMADAINEYSGSAVSAGGFTRRGEDVRAERFGDSSDDWRTSSNEASQELEILEEYLRVDLDGDGYPELIRSYRLGDLLLEESEVEENPFGSWTPIRLPHRFMGQSIHDITADLQLQSTVLNRAVLDATYQSVVNREAYDETRVDVDSLLATYSGSKVAVKGSPRDAILPLTGGLDTAKSALSTLELLARRLEDRTGVTRQAQGMDPDALLKGPHSGKAIDLLQTAAGARKEVFARNMGAGLEAFLAKLYRLVCRNQNEPRQVRAGGKWARFDPRTWNSDLRVSVHTGLGTGNREQTLFGLQVIAQFQEAVIDKLGTDNPNVTMKNVHRLQEELCRALGWKSADPFFTEAPDQPVVDEQGRPVMDPETGEPQMKPWAPPPQPSAEMAKVQADAQAKQAELALKTQDTQATLQLQQQKDAAAAEQEAMKAAAQLQIMREKAALDAELAREKAAAEIELAWAKFQAEITLAREKQAAEVELERERIESQERVSRAKMTADDVNIPENRPGGALDE